MVYTRPITTVGVAVVKSIAVLTRVVPVDREVENACQQRVLGAASREARGARRRKKNFARRGRVRYR